MKKAVHSRGLLVIFNFAQLQTTSLNIQLNFRQPHFNWLSHLSFTSTPNHAY